MKKIKLKDIASIKTGFQVRGKLTQIDDGTHKIIQMRNIYSHSGGIIEHNDFCKVVPSSKHLNKYLLKKGNVILLTRGNYNSATLISEKYTNFIASGQFMIFDIFNQECSPAYLEWYLNTTETQLYFNSEAKGTNIKIIDKKSVGDLFIKLPDLETQRNLVKINNLAKREEVLLDTLKEKRKKLIYGYSKLLIKKR